MIIGIEQKNYWKTDEFCMLPMDLQNLFYRLLLSSTEVNCGLLCPEAIQVARAVGMDRDDIYRLVDRVSVVFIDDDDFYDSYPEEADL